MRLHAERIRRPARYLDPLDPNHQKEAGQSPHGRHVARPGGPGGGRVGGTAPEEVGARGIFSSFAVHSTARSAPVIGGRTRTAVSAPP